MIAYVRSRKDFRTIHKAFAQGWNVSIMSSSDEQGTVIIPLGDRKDFTGDILYLDDHLFLIDESSPEDGMITLTTSDMVNLFARQIKYPSATELEEHNIFSYGDFVTYIIERDYIACADEKYEIPYIIVNNMDAVEFEEPKVDNAGIFKLTDVIATAREKGVLFQFGIDHNKLILDISSPISVPHNVKFDDGHAVLDNETFSRKKTAKISAMHATDTSGVYEESIWYLSAEGEIFQNEEPENRADGDWIYLTVQKDDDVETKVAEKFKENLSSHKIEFYSDRKYYLWDTLRFEIDGEMLESSVISVSLSSDNKRYLYKCGDLATTLTEKVQKLS